MFATLNEMKEHLSIALTDATYDIILNNFLFGSGARLLSILNLTQVAQASYTDILDIKRRQTAEVKLRSYPVVSITSITHDSRTLTGGSYLRPIGRLKLKSDTFYQSVQETEVQYVAGFDSAAVAGTDLMFEAFKLAQLEAVRVWFSQHQETAGGGAGGAALGALKRREIGEFVEEYHKATATSGAGSGDADASAADLPDTARGMIRQFIRKTPVTS